MSDVEKNIGTHKPGFDGEWVRLGDVCEIVNGATPRTEVPEYWDGDIKWVTPAELRNEIHIVFDTAKHLTKAGFESASLRMMPVGTILLTTRAPIGKLALAGDEMCCNQGFKCLICPETVNNEWLCRLLKHRVPELQAMGTGATFKELSKRAISDYKICVPPMEAQIDIVKKLTKLDEVLANCRALLSALDDLVKSQFVEIVSASKFSKESVRLGDIGAFQTGGTPSRSHSEYYGGQIPWISTPALNGSVIDASDANEGITQLGVDNSATKVIPAGSLMVGIRVGVGKVAINAVPMCTNQDIVSISGIDSAKWSVTYLSHAIQGQSERLRAQKRGATITGITTKALKELQITRCSIQEQQQFADFVAKVDKLGFDVQQQIEKLETLKQSLMQEYFG